MTARNRQQAAVEALLAWATTHRGTWPFDDPFDRVLRATLADATKTYAAAAVLTSSGYGAPALKLARSLVESMVVAYWTVHVADRAWVVERMRDHLEFGNSVLVAALEAHAWPEHGYSDVRRAAVAADSARLTTLFGQHAEAAWWARDVEPRDDGRWRVTTTRSLRDLVDDLLTVDALEEKLWEKGDGGERAPTPLIRQILDIPQRINNQLLHHNPAGLAGHVDQVDQELQFDDGPSDQWVPQARVLNLTTFGLTLQLITDYYAPNLSEELERLVNAELQKGFGGGC